jgi:hypothetical protein
MNRSGRIEAPPLLLAQPTKQETQSFILNIQPQIFNPSCQTALSSGGSLSRVANNTENHKLFLLKECQALTVNYSIDLYRGLNGHVH